MQWNINLFVIKKKKEKKRFYNHFQFLSGGGIGFPEEISFQEIDSGLYCLFLLTLSI